jgi:hypothetical protein
LSAGCEILKGRADDLVKVGHLKVTRLHDVAEGEETVPCRLVLEFVNDAARCLKKFEFSQPSLIVTPG